MIRSLQWFQLNESSQKFLWQWCVWCVLGWGFGGLIGWALERYLLVGAFAGPQTQAAFILRPPMLAGALVFGLVESAIQGRTARAWFGVNLPLWMLLSCAGWGFDYLIAESDTWPGLGLGVLQWAVFRGPHRALWAWPGVSLIAVQLGQSLSYRVLDVFWMSLGGIPAVFGAAALSGMAYGLVTGLYRSLAVETTPATRPRR